MALSWRLRPAEPADAGDLAAIEREAFPDTHWTADDFFRYDCVVAVAAEGLCGFLVSRETYQNEREILNLAVASGVHRSGVGRSLLAHELKRQATVFLEVRASNVAAIQLYKNAGFIEVSRRHDYYDNPMESAIVMCWK